MSVYAIQIPDRKERERAITVWLNVRENYVRVPNNIFGVGDGHIEALKNAHPPIAFVPATREMLNGQTTSVQPSSTD